MARKKEAHHGGAWKVAYADFVTAMMALFMVLWICAQDKKILLATSEYFQSPFNAQVAKSKSDGIMEFNSSRPNKGSGSQDSGGVGASSDPKEVDLQFLNSVASDFYRLLNLDEDFAAKPIEIQVTSDGMRITLFDRARKPLFKDQTAEFTEWGNFMMQNLSWLIERHRFQVVIEGHTRTGMVFPEGYTAWDLSSDRANAARRALTHYAVDEKRIDRVTGYAATRPVPDEPTDSESNQRVTLSLSMGKRERKPFDSSPIQ
ncbi:MAG TPA: flagellar motor protein MotB [Opitutaceae bacterium]|jgi:chemotaxis protein MotB|nr:OmpA family protein [Opitutaceae bacterium]OQB97510.1 MAG: Motility protein B [Verrucomicrobia bacterium ADurb.Bin122]MBP8962057.1 OmpA family protein [Opitutaceae bacterium]HOD46026.1 flagellar motor protein MotB [Opitutaceae bacterium]HOF08468.1 flagellar motor protein MotB [Opitutaceae bacterium]